MKTILSLDISSSTIGFSYFEEEQTISLISYGHIKPPSKLKASKLGFGFSYRLAEMHREISALIDKFNPDVVVVEDYAKKFSAGRSSANTIIVLATSNEVISLAYFQKTGREVVRIPVRTLRKLVKEEYKTDVKDKEDALALCLKLFSKFKTVNNKAGNIKKECYDESDSVIVGLGYHIQTNNLAGV